MATALAVARGQHHCSQATSLQNWFVHNHVWSAATLRCPVAVKVSAALSDNVVTLAVGRRHLLAGFAAMTAGASQVCRLGALAFATSVDCRSEHPSLPVYVCSPNPSCSQFWNQKHNPAAYQQTWTMPHRAHFGSQGFPESSTRVTNFSRSAWGRNVFYGLTFFVPRAAAALVRHLSPRRTCSVVALVHGFVQHSTTVVKCAGGLLSTAQHTFTVPVASSTKLCSIA